MLKLAITVRRKCLTASITINDRRNGSFAACFFALLLWSRKQAWANPKVILYVLYSIYSTYRITLGKSSEKRSSENRDARKLGLLKVFRSLIAEAVVRILAERSLFLSPESVAVLITIAAFVSCFFALQTAILHILFQKNVTRWKDYINVLQQCK